jgi:hypothetical protein
MARELFLNGIDADSGSPIDGDLIVDTELIAKVARGQKLTPEDLKDARLRRALDASQVEHFGVAEGIDLSDLAQAGWGLVFPASLPKKSVDAIKDALRPLLDLRRSQASLLDSGFYKEFTGLELGYYSGESKNDFLKRFGRGPGPADPAKGMPYYILIAGSPDTIPFSFQYQLDVQYAVGRIYFERLEDYYQYAQSVVTAETKKFARQKKAAFFGVANPDDKATAMSSTQLIQPLAKQMKDRYKDWKVDLIAPEKATKATLGSYMGGKETPALLFSASHGMSFKPDDLRLLRHTGAILTQDWPGAKARLPVTDTMYFSADDIASDADVFGMIAFVFACYGGGIPKSDNFYRQAFGRQKDIAPYAFISQLPIKLLSHPKGGALGVFAHVERAWGSSIVWDGAVNDIATFDSTINALLNGKPAGAATEYFNQRYAEISTMLNEELDQTSPENQDDVKIAGMWTSNNDARNYTFIGDPAVRLAVADKQTALPERQNLGSIVSSLPASVTGPALEFQPDVVDRAPTIPGAASGWAGSNYGLSDLFKKDEAVITEGGIARPATGGINESLINFIDKVGNFLSKALDDATSLEVSTYVADDLENIKYANGKYIGARLRAMTRVNIDGDTLVCLPEKDGEVDTTIWNIHLEMVKSAQENRAELMKTIVGAVANMINVVK